MMNKFDQLVDWVLDENNNELAKMPGGGGAGYPPYFQTQPATRSSSPPTTPTNPVVSAARRAARRAWKRWDNPPNKNIANRTSKWRAPKDPFLGTIGGLVDPVAWPEMPREK